LLVA
jgi:hypothetical protein